MVCLGILASIWRYEERNDGHEGIIRGVRKEQFTNAHGEPDEEPETIGIPRNIVIPLRQVCTRLGRPLPYLSQSDVSLHNYKASALVTEIALVLMQSRFETQPRSIHTFPARRIWTCAGPFSTTAAKRCSCSAWFVISDFLTRLILLIGRSSWIIHSWTRADCAVSGTRNGEGQ